MWATNLEKTHGPPFNDAIFSLLSKVLRTYTFTYSVHNARHAAAQENRGSHTHIGAFQSFLSKPPHPAFQT